MKFSLWDALAKVFPVYGNFSLQTGRLFLENKDALILEVENPTSNYGAANIFVLDVFAIARVGGICCWT